MPSLKSRIADFIFQHTSGKLKFPADKRIETFWTLDISNNSAVRVGELLQLPGSVSSWMPAPGFRFAINVPSINRGRQFFLCDLDENTLQKINLTGFIRGWWDEHCVVARNSSNYILFDVASRKTSTLLAISDISRFLDENGITNDPAALFSFFHWNNSNYDMYISATGVNGQYSKPTFLVRVGHDGPRLKLLYRNLSFRAAGWFDDSGTHYVFSGSSKPPASGGDGSVWLRNLADDTERLVVPPDNLGQYAMARLYSNTVIYWRNNVLWRVDINTTNSSQLLPASAQ